MAAGRSTDPRDPPPDPPTVAAVTERLKEIVESRFGDVWVAGEVSNLTRAGSGHVYLSLKDESALLRGVVWRSTVPTLAIQPADGMQVVCHGRLEIYPPRGSYQITIDRLHALGTGPLEAQLRRLHARLAAEGLFAAERKRPIPPFPRRIALVTSPTGAAIADFLQTFFSRWRGSEVVVVPARVQGAGAAEEVAAAVALAARLRPRVDVIAVVRGGGSLEDLWAFNEEPLVRAVAASPIPVVAGIGHEIDVSLADLAADLRALTPTDAAVRIAPDRRELAAAVASLTIRLGGGLARRVGLARERLDMLARSRILADPGRLVGDRRQVLDDRARRLTLRAETALDRAGERLAAATARLEAGSPLQLLSRGWSVTFRERTVEALRSVAGLDVGDRIVTQLADGRVTSRVESVASAPADGRDRNQSGQGARGR